MYVLSNNAICIIFFNVCAGLNPELERFGYCVAMVTVVTLCAISLSKLFHLVCHALLVLVVKLHFI